METNIERATRELEERWDKSLGIRSTSDLNNIIRANRINNIFVVCEVMHDQFITKLADDIIAKNKRVILIAGPSSSGKTTFAKKLCTHLWANGRKPLYLGTDDYFIDRGLIPFEPDGSQDFENLSAIDVGMFNRHINALLKGERVDTPVYNFKLGVKEFGQRFLRLADDQPIVIEGIHGLNDALTPDIPDSEKYRIFICPLSQLLQKDGTRINMQDTRKLRRTVRDHSKRGWGVEETFTMWPNVIAAEQKNIFAFAPKADAVFNSSQPYEIAVLKGYAVPLLESVSKDSVHRAEADRLLGILSYIHDISDDSHIEEGAIIREFIGGGFTV